MMFLSPLLLGAAGAALLPLALHLMARRQTVRMAFSTVRFLKLAQKRSSSRVRMENFILWLLRTLLMLLLALAFAKPVLRMNGASAFGSLLGNSRRDVAIVWDASYSMGYESGSKNVWETSKDTVASLIGGLNKGDRVCLFLAADNVVPLIGEPTTDLDLALATVKSQTLRTGRSNLTDATLAALAALKDTNHEREFYLISDGQSSAWDGFRNGASTPSAASAPPADAQPGAPGAKPIAGSWNPESIDKKNAFFVALLGAREPINSAPAGVEIQPPLIMSDTAAQVRVQLVHTGPAQQNSVALFVDDREVNRRAVSFEQDAGAEAVLSVPPLPVGTHRARVETADDALPIDNSYNFLIKVRQELPVLIAGSPDDCFFLEHALAPAEKNELKTRRIATDALATEVLDGYPCIFLCNALPLSGPAIGNVEEYVRRGGVVVLFPGDRANAADYGAWSALPARVERVADMLQTMDRRSLVLLDALDPLFAGLKLPPGSAPSLTIHRELSFGKLQPDAKTLIGAPAQTPLLLSRKFGSGRVLMFAVSADRQWSDLPLSPFFLPITHQAVRFAADLGRDKAQVQPSASFALSDIISKVPEGATLTGPEQETLPIRRIQKAGAGSEIALYVDNVTKPGYYYLTKENQPSAEPLIAVNVDRAESDLKPVRAEEIPKILGLKSVNVATDRAELERQITEHRIGRPMSELVLWAVLVLAVIELFVANRGSRKRKTLSETMVVHASGRVLSQHAVTP